ncbi:bifunctional diaminohydroxyphosphoribosylaminopyrimidine deaminase/5-amino-6-(5-phosphoribosylamino)uracil reductase RibD [Rhizobium sp. CG5]|uniref:bifunctional diaminohydroxyphosphoribosylaminopyrimidine deaminase/5-amino-6-(5-phosphoribosylamino)uracil reductase RibD n=1 Tax=Rhizobium sp. CG5 TaxID=2726076 RepID=UPI0020336824|nr:bifunctional diaminohydroxyphosphoribosylaminopyrimidine deaminase/5-amino-6-(5-phosphoribosylamino)uracil reductase RibD [Rhizobium sp. CG5]MCM2473902.1 bifunctional diaminohydroxyphosphoribosylaminopyrimidine deaminase/5-amino-6-(5-phosphoribosylamino)uracil reductase RibD [Rhizobium sp. CG5]
MSGFSHDRRYMAAAIRLSLTHLGQTSTNPSVGCIIVKDDRIVGRGVTALSGRPHAETEALADAGEQARGATAYVTLEPCSHHGRTPPCAHALVEAGIARVVVAVTDPDPRVSGRGLKILEDAGIAVTVGVLEQPARRALAYYLSRQTQKRPYVILKLAVSVDGMLGRAGAGQVRITGDRSRAVVHALRAETDAILVGIGTALADDPELTVRIPGLEARSPVRIVLDRRLELPLTSKLVQTAQDVPVFLVTDGRSAEAGVPPSALPGISPSRGEIESGRALASADTSEIVETIGVRALISPLEGEMSGRTEGGIETTNYSVDLTHRGAALRSAGVEIVQATTLADLLMTLAVRGISSVLVEGGAATAKAFLDAGLVDRILLFQGPDKIGADGIASPLTTANIPDEFSRRGTKQFGADICTCFERAF